MGHSSKILKKPSSHLNIAILVIGILGGNLDQRDSVLWAGTNPYATQKEEIQKQGDIAFTIIEERFLDRRWSECSEDLQTFLILYPNHPKEEKARELLSRAYKKQHLWLEAAEVELSVYRKNPSSEAGILAYLNAGRLFVRVGEIYRATQIFETIKSQTYSVKLSQEAEIELQQIQILEEKS